MSYEQGGMSAADAAAFMNSRNNGFGDGWYGIIGLMVIAGMFGGFGGWGFGGNRGGDVLTTAESCNMNSFNEMKSQIGRMNDMMFANARQNDNAICNAQYTNLQNFNEVMMTIKDCCCKLETAIHGEGEATRSMMQTNKIESLQTQLNDVKMQQMFCGVPRIPTTFTYSVNPASLFNGNCNTQCNNPIFS